MIRLIDGREETDCIGWVINNEPNSRDKNIGIKYYDLILKNNCF